MITPSTISLLEKKQTMLVTVHCRNVLVPSRRSECLGLCFGPLGPPPPSTNMENDLFSYPNPSACLLVQHFDPCHLKWAHRWHVLSMWEKDGDILRVTGHQEDPGPPPLQEAPPARCRCGLRRSFSGPDEGGRWSGNSYRKRSGEILGHVEDRFFFFFCSPLLRCGNDTV